MSADATPQRGPLPAVAIQQTIQKQLTIGAAADESRQVPSPPPPPPLLLRVEVETRQGYVYEGKLVSLDDNYNINLAEATLWRDRLCDVERALLVAGGLPAPMKLSATRRRYLGSVFIRSSNLLMVRFLQADGSTDEGGGGRGGAAAILKATFKSMAAKIKRQINMERQKNRMERRQRKRMAIRQPLQQQQQPAAAAAADGGKRGARGGRKGNSRSEASS